MSNNTDPQKEVASVKTETDDIFAKTPDPDDGDKDINCTKSKLEIDESKTQESKGHRQTEQPSNGIEDNSGGEELVVAHEEIEEDCEFEETADSSKEKMDGGDQEAKHEKASSEVSLPSKDEGLAEQVEQIDRQTASNNSPSATVQQSQPQKESGGDSAATQAAAASQQRDQLACSIWIRNITNTTKAADLKALFSKHGKVLTAKIFTTKNKQSPTCFGYVTLSDTETADGCVQKLNRLNFKGRVIHVEKADHSNLSQINKSTSTAAATTTSSQVPQKAGEGSSTTKKRKTPEIVEVTPSKNKTGTSHSKSSSGTKRPRITASAAARESAKGKESSSTSNWKAPSYSSRNRRYSGGATGSKSRHVSSYVQPAATVHTAANYGRMPQPIDKYAPERRVIQTSRGVRVTTYPTPSVYNPRSTRVAEADSSHHHMRSSHSSSRATYSPPTQSIDKEEMLRMLHRREEEHRKKEEELNLEREREKLKYEREKLEREKLELETYKLHAQLAQAAQLQIAGLPAAAALNPAAAAAFIGSTSGSAVHQQFIPQYIRPNEPMVAAASARQGGAKEGQKVEKRGRSSKEESSASRYRNESSRSSHGNADSRRAHGEKSTKRNRSRSPYHRSGAGGGRSSRAKEQRQPSSYSRNKYQEGGDQKRSGGGRDEIVPSAGGKNMAPPVAHIGEQYGTNKGTSAYFYGSAPALQPTARNYSTDPIRQQERVGHGRVSPQTRSRDFFGTNSNRYDALNLTSAAADSYSARTDPSYASRIGGGQHRTADDMFGRSIGGGGGSSFTLSVPQVPQDVVTANYGGAQQYGGRSEQLGASGGGNSFFQQRGATTTWDVNKGGAGNIAENARPNYLNANTWNTAGGGGGDWNRMYEPSSSSNQQAQSTSGRFQSQPYGGGKPGGSSYSTGGRRY